MKNYNYSIIIPHKNIPDLLQRCLDSIPKRDDIQVIIVDDNSNPNIVDFARFPGLTRPNCEIYFDKSGKGAGRARNVGLSHALGEWVLFSDADDRFEIGINSILDQLTFDNSDLVYFGVISKDSDSLVETEEAVPFCETLKRKDDFELRYRLLTPWMKAVRLSFIKEHNIKFEEVPCGNDTRFSALCGYYAKKINIIDRVGYCWMRRDNSLWRNIDINWCITRYKVNMNLSRFMSRHNEIRAKKFFEGSAYGFLQKIENYSRCKYIWYTFIYGIESRNRRIVFINVPRYCLYHFRLKLGITQSLREIIHNCL